MERPDWCRIEIGANVTPAREALLAAQLQVTRLQLERENLPVDAVLLVGPDDFEGLTLVAGCALVRVPHWPGKPCLLVPARETVNEVYGMARRLQDAGVRAERLHLFGPPGVQYLKVWLPPGRDAARLLQGVPVDQRKQGLMIGVELT